MGDSSDKTTKLFEGLSTPISLFGSNPENDVVVGTDELTGKKIYRNKLTGRNYTIGEYVPPKTIPEIAKDTYEAIPPLNEWEAPSFDDIYNAAEAMVSGTWEGVKHVVSSPTNPDATLGDALGVAGSMGLGGIATSAGMKGAEGATGMFLGQYAKHADLQQLIRAKDMINNGYSAEEVWRATGWAEAPDGKWVWEIDDSQAGFNPDFYIKSGMVGVSGKVSDSFVYPELFDNYPNRLSSAKVSALLPDEADKRLGESTLGDHSPSTNQIRVRAGDKATSTMLHELQHGVQTEEGMSAGSNPDYIYNQIKAELDNLPDEAMYYLKSLSDLKGTKNEIYRVKSALARDTIDDFDKEALDDYLNQLEKHEKIYSNGVKGYAKELHSDFIPELNKFSDFLGEFLSEPDPFSFSPLVAHKIYEDNTGEYLARKTQGRQQMNAAQRSTYYPFRDAPEKSYEMRQIRGKVDSLAARRMQHEVHKAFKDSPPVEKK